MISPAVEGVIVGIAAGVITLIFCPESRGNTVSAWFHYFTTLLLLVFIYCMVRGVAFLWIKGPTP